MKIVPYQLSILLFCIIFGLIFFTQEHGYEENGIFASLIPQVKSMQSNLGVERRLDTINSKLEDVNKNLLSIGRSNNRTITSDEFANFCNNDYQNGNIQFALDVQKYGVGGQIKNDLYIEALKKLNPDQVNNFIWRTKDNVESFTFKDLLIVAGAMTPFDNSLFEKLILKNSNHLTFTELSTLVEALNVKDAKRSVVENACDYVNPITADDYLRLLNNSLLSVPSPRKLNCVSGSFSSKEVTSYLNMVNKDDRGFFLEKLSKIRPLSPDVFVDVVIKSGIHCGITPIDVKLSKKLNFDDVISIFDSVRTSKVGKYLEWTSHAVIGYTAHDVYIMYKRYGLSKKALQDILINLQVRNIGIQSSNEDINKLKSVVESYNRDLVDEVFS